MPERLQGQPRGLNIEPTPRRSLGTVLRQEAAVAGSFVKLGAAVGELVIAQALMTKDKKLPDKRTKGEKAKAAKSLIRREENRDKERQAEQRTTKGTTIPDPRTDEKKANEAETLIERDN